jgi:hypothetical protein
MAEAFARRRNTDEVAKAELLAHARQHLEWQVQQAAALGEDNAIVPIFRCLRSSFT